MPPPLEGAPPLSLFRTPIPRPHPSLPSFIIVSHFLAFALPIAFRADPALNQVIWLSLKVWLTGNS